MQYRRMYETRNVRPYYSMLHLGVFGAAFKKLTGFEYRNIVYVTSADMNNAAYFEENELKTATEYFGELWLDTEKTQSLIAVIQETFKEAEKFEAWGWQQQWSLKSEKELKNDILKLYDLLWRVFGTMIISQPQHVSSLEKRMEELLEGVDYKDKIFRSVTAFAGIYPWAEEDNEIKKLHTEWSQLSPQDKESALDRLVSQYGWFNEVEGNQPYDRKHYEDKVLSYKEEILPEKLSIEIAPEIKELGALIGQLGFLRFCNRYHFMHIRYHLNKAREALINRKSEASLEYATIEELIDYCAGEFIDLDQIAQRRHGYISILFNGKTSILVGPEAEGYKKAVEEEHQQVKEIKGSIANKGCVRGRVRVISFSAKDYNEEMEAFAQGEILVTGMTRPQIVHLCRKAAAIVTDEGGITSHAAVISRELNVPCVIATHNATNVLKTGDMVEVDADHGIIRIIE